MFNFSKILNSFSLKILFVKNKSVDYYTKPKK